ncbi:MAG TPA: carboxylating nicotinate-nucleotide diphosphorylase [Gammaproteobacteria bacterium]
MATVGSSSDLKLTDDIAAAVTRALAEDIGSGDVTAALIDEKLRAEARVVARESAVLCGAAWFDEVFRQIDSRVAVRWLHNDGARIDPDTIVCTVEGPARALLTGERTALNFLQTLSGTATAASRFAEAVRGTSARILDTRKTLPGLRAAQKYAVRCGGAYNHRQGLYDAILIKENHIAAVGSIETAVSRARAQAPSLLLEIEVENIEQLRAALETAADRILLDNFEPAELREAVAIRNAHKGKRKELEVSGNIDLDNVRTVAETGVDWISTGAITKNVRATDYSMRFV